MQVLGPSDFRVMPWRNGGGVTRELYMEHSIGPESFDLRLSIATIKNSAPFSQFPEHQRTIVQLHGKPMTLLHEARQQTLSLLEPYEFDGAIKTAGLLQDQSPVEDFNVMIRKGWGQASVTVQRVEFYASSPKWLLYIYRGTAEITQDMQKVTALHDHLIVGESAFSVKIPAPNTILFFVSVLRV